jgi:uncharacterized protein (DUF736 family)
MSDYDNTNSGALFKNDKQGNDNWPDYRGQINVNGEDFWISAWLKTSKKDGTKYMSLAVQPMQKQKQSSPKASPQQGRQRQPEPPQNDFDDDIPFN